MSTNLGLENQLDSTKTVATSVYHFVTETAQLMVDSWEVWTYSLISSLGLQYAPNEAQYTVWGS